MSRAKVRDTAHASLARGDALAWFERVYEDAAGAAEAVPWADLAPNPELVAWTKSSGWDGCGERALVVGCGLGDDAAWLSARGCHVSAFDLSKTAIAWCEKRFPDSRVAWRVADLLAPPAEWSRAFDFVFEAYTIQSLPPASDERRRAIAGLARFVAPGGTLLVLGREADALPALADGPPWALVRAEIEACGAGLAQVGAIDRWHEKGDPVGRFRLVCRRDA
ncbi:MAG TPA: class I SAM-dependent methyltransferase [Labilithrix sp.]